MVFSARADTPTVFFNLGDFTTAPIAYKQVRIAPAPSSFPRVEGSQVIGRDLIFKSTDASGQFYITNMVPGDYDVTFTNRFLPTTFRITVTNYSGVLNAVDLTSAGTNSPSNLAAYSQSAANARFVLKTNGSAHNLSITATSTPSPSAGQVLTYGPGGVAAWSNAPAVGGISVAQGTNIITVTNGSVVTVHGTSTGGGGSGDMTAAIDGLAITNALTGKLDTNSGTGMFNTFFEPRTINLTNTGTLGVEGDTYIGGDLSGPQIRTINSANQIQMGDGAAALTTFLVQGQVGSLQIGNDTWRFFGTNNGGFWLQSEDMGADHPMLFFNGGRIGHATNNPQATLHVANTYTDGSIMADGHITSQKLVTNRIVVVDATGKLINASGTPTGAKFLRDDGTLATPGGSGDMVLATDGVAITNWIQTAHDTNAVQLLAVIGLTNLVQLNRDTNAAQHTALVGLTNLVQLNRDTNAAQQAALVGLTNLVQLAHDTNALQQAALVGLTNIAATKIAINGGGGTNNYFTNAFIIGKLFADANTNSFWVVSNSSATAVGVLHLISTNGGGERSIFSINRTNGDVSIAGAMSMDQLNMGTLLLTNWMSIGGPFTNTGSSYLVGPVQASSTVIATNFIPTRRVLFASTNNSAVTNILLNVTNDAALTIYSTNHLVWTNIAGLRAEIQPSFVVTVYPQFTLTNLWPSGNVHGYRIQTNDNSTLWSTFTNGNKYVISGTADGTNLALTVTRFSQ